MRMNGEEARKFKERWALVNQAALEESRRKTLEERLDETDERMLWAASFEDPLREEEVAEVRARWVRLKRLAGG